MRDSVGGTFMIYVLLIFLAVYITFVAVAFNYARAFRVKNKVIDIIEQNEGIADYRNTSGAMADIDYYLNEVSYRVNGINDNTDVCSGFDYINSEKGYCITKISTASDLGSGTASYYKVITFVRLEIPFLDLGFTIPVKGETRKIERIS